MNISLKDFANFKAIKSLMFTIFALINSVIWLDGAALNALMMAFMITQCLIKITS